MTTTTTITEPGIYPDMTDAEYFGGPGLNHSTLRWLMEHPPAVTRYRLDNPEHEATADMIFGTAVHALVLGGAPIAPIAADSWRSNVAKEARDEALADGRIPLLVVDAVRAEEVADKVRVHPLAAKLLATADHTEVVVKWFDGDLLMKAKFDGISGRYVWDLKTTYNADANAFGRSAAKYGYATQAAMYLDGARSLGIDDPQFLFVAVEKEPPYLVNVIKLDDYDVELGAGRLRKAIETYRECANSGHWPGYSEGVQVAQLPRWAEIEMETE